MKKDEKENTQKSLKDFESIEPEKKDTLNLHELVDEYIRTNESLESILKHFLNCNKIDLKSLINFSKLIPKLENPYSKIMLQYLKEDTLVAIYELERMNDPNLHEKSVAHVLLEKWKHE